MRKDILKGIVDLLVRRITPLAESFYDAVEVKLIKNA
jgi:hypothetical protein